MGISGYRISEGEPTYPNGSSLIYKMSIKAYSPEEAAAIYSLYASILQTLTFLQLHYGINTNSFHLRDKETE